MIDKNVMARLRQDVMKKLLYDIRKELENDGAVFTENMTDSDLLMTESQSITQLEIEADIAQELRDGHYRILFGEITKSTKRNRKL